MVVRLGLLPRLLPAWITFKAAHFSLNFALAIFRRGNLTPILPEEGFLSELQNASWRRIDLHDMFSDICSDAIFTIAINVFSFSPP